MKIPNRKATVTEKKALDDVLNSTVKHFSGDRTTKDFIEIFLTEHERQTIARRIMIAQLLVRGKTQREISGDLGVSPNTIALTRTWLEQEQLNYNEVYMKQKQKMTKPSTRLRSTKGLDPFTFSGLRHKYPLHFLLYNIAENTLKELTKKRSEN